MLKLKLVAASFENLKNVILKILKRKKENKYIIDLKNFNFDMRFEIGEGVIFEIHNDNNKFGDFKMREFPGCCGICILYNVWVRGDYQQNGIGTQIFDIAEKIAYGSGYTIIMCTDTEASNSRKILSKNKWKDVDNFVNNRTTNTVFITTKNVRK